jgi:starch synthase
MKIVIASPEAVPFIKTGGLADVAGTLWKEYRIMKHEANIILPLYKKIKDSRIALKDMGITIHVPVGDRVAAGRIYSDQSSAFFIRCDEFFDRQELYGTSQGDYSDNASRFIFFSRGILETCKALNLSPDIIHCNDWQTGLVPLYLKTFYKGDACFRKAATFFSIHNIGYQGLFPASEMQLTNLGNELFTPEGIEFYGEVNFLKAGLLAADILGTVSTTYAKEILMKEYSFGLDGVLRKRKDDLYGIINGIDYGEWDPSRDVFLPAAYSHKNISGKALCKRELLQALFHPQDLAAAERMPLMGMVGRLTAQKGLDLVFEAVPELLSFGVKLAILGKGDEKYQRDLKEIARRHKGMISVTVGFDDSFAHRLYAGTDFFLMPSRYEPCGLGQLIALRYGSIPIARRTGGLADTILDYNPLASKGTGFLFTDYTPSAFLDAVKRALCVYTDDQKKPGIITEGMKMDYSWKKSAQRYIGLYKDALAKKRL